MEAFKCRGEWWLPDAPERMVGGTLRFSPEEGATLELSGSLAPRNSPDTVFAPELVFGVAAEKGRITLWRCFESNRTISGPVEVSTLHARVAFLGSLVDPNQPVFRSLHVHSPSIHHWANLRWADVEFALAGRFSMNLRRPRPIEAALPDGSTAGLAVEVRGPTLSWIQTELRAEGRTFAVFRSCIPRSFDELFSRLNVLLQLVTLATSSPAVPREVKVTCAPHPDTGIDQTTLSVFYKAPLSLPGASSSLRPHQMLFTFADIADDFAAYVNTWYKRAVHLSPVFALYFGSVGSDRMYIEHRFLNMVLALEVYHRLILDGSELPDGEYQALVSQVVEAAPVERRKWLKDILKHKNEPNLRKRLRQLCDSFPDLVAALVQNPKGFVNRVVDKRNFLMHEFGTPRQRSAEARDLLELAEQLQCILEACLLRELGFGSDWIHERILALRVNRRSNVL